MGVQVSRRDLSDLLRSVGGLVFAAGAVVLLIRKSGDQGWSDFARLLVVLLPTVVLYRLALEAPREERARPWQSVLMVTAILLIPVALFEFLHWVGASTRQLLFDALVFALTGLLAGYAARRARVAYSGLLAALALLVAWLLVWSKILNHPSANTFRWLLVASALLLLLVAARLMRAGAIAASEVATAGGIAAVAAGIFGVIIGAFAGFAQSFTTSSVSSGSQIASGPLLRNGHLLRHGPGIRQAPSIQSEPLTRHGVTHMHTTGLQHLGWDIYLLIASLALIWIGSRVRARGLGYVGGIGVAAFVISVGAQITRLEAGHAPTAGLVGWPLALLIIGAAALAASLARPRAS
jgi:hypothetical protein